MFYFNEDTVSDLTAIADKYRTLDRQQLLNNIRMTMQRHGIEVSELEKFINEYKEDPTPRELASKTRKLGNKSRPKTQLGEIESRPSKAWSVIG